MSGISRLGVLVGLLVLTLAAAAAAAPFAYVTNFGSSSVSVVDVATDTVPGSPIPVHGFPGGVAVSANAARVYVASQFADGPSPNLISVIDTATRGVVAEIPLTAGAPAGLALTPDGSRLFVTHTVTSGPTLTVIDTASNTVLTTIQAGLFNGGVVVHPNGRKLYIATGSDVRVYDPLTLAPLGSIQTFNRPYGLAVNPAGTRLFIANYSGNSVSVVDTAADTIHGEVITGNAPFALSVSPDGSKVFVGNQNSRTLSVVDTATLTVIHDVPLGAAMPYGVQSGPDGSRVYVADFANSKLLVVDAVNGVVLAQIAVGSLPIAFGEFIRAAVTATTLSPGGVSPAEVIVGTTAPVSLRAVLTRSGGAPVAGATVEFLMDGTVVGSGVTGSDGIATLGVQVGGMSVGPRAVTARFGGGAVNGMAHGASTAALGTLRIIYKFTGFLPPLRDEVNRRGAGAMVLAKWRLSNAAGFPIGDLNTVVGVYVGTMSCGGNPSVWSAVGGTLTYESGEFAYKWKTDKTLDGACARLSVALTDGTAHAVDFNFR